MTEPEMFPEKLPPAPHIIITALGYNDVQIWYNGLKLQNVIRVQFDVGLDEVTEVTVTFRGVAVEYQPKLRRDE